MILKDIHIPDDILAQLQERLLSDKGHEEGIRVHQIGLLQQRLAQVNRRTEQAYIDKLDGTHVEAAHITTLINEASVIAMLRFAIKLKGIPTRQRAKAANHQVPPQVNQSG